MPNEFRVGDVVRRVYDSPWRDTSTYGFDTGWGVVGQEYVVTASEPSGIASDSWCSLADDTCFELVRRADDPLPPREDTEFQVGDKVKIVGGPLQEGETGYISAITVDGNIFVSNQQNTSLARHTEDIFGNWHYCILGQNLEKVSMYYDSAGKPVSVGDHILITSGTVFTRGCVGQVAKINDISSFDGFTLTFPWSDSQNFTQWANKEQMEFYKVKFVPGDVVERVDGSLFGDGVSYRKTIEKVTVSSWGELQYWVIDGGWLEEESIRKVGTAPIPPQENPYKVGDLVLYDGNRVDKVSSIESHNKVRLGGVYGVFYTKHLEPYVEPEDVAAWGGYEKAYHNISDSRLFSYLEGGHKRLVLQCFAPAIKVEGETLKIALYKSREDFQRDRRVVMKLGRAIKLMYADYTDKQVEQLVDEIRKKFTPRSYTLKTSLEAADFKHAYQHKQSPFENIRTTSGRKSLASSCMRYKFDQKYHPAEAYASGDFMIVWTEDKDGYIGSRCVVCINRGDGLGQKEWRAGPVYGVDERSIDLIEQYVHDNGGVLFEENDDWEGARLQVLRDGGGLIGPYFDNGQSLTDEGDYLRVCSGGEIVTSSYNGYLEGGRVCYNCEEVVDEEYAVYNEEGNCFCEDCYSERYVYSEYEGDVLLRDEAVEVHANNRWGHYFVWHYSNNEGITFEECAYTGEYWESDHIEYDYDDQPVATSYAESHLTLCAESGKWCDPKDTVEVDGDWYHKSEAPETELEEEAA